jgi:hypothetical protein
MKSEDAIKLGKCRGGRGTQVIKNKKKYDRKKDKRVDKNDY